MILAGWNLRWRNTASEKYKLEKLYIFQKRAPEVFDLKWSTLFLPTPIWGPHAGHPKIGGSPKPRGLSGWVPY